MSALPKPKRSRKIELVLRAIDPDKCWVCGRDLNSHDVLDAKEHYRHVRRQEENGFKRGKTIVHFTAAQREAEARACSERINAALAERTAKETQAPAKPLETPQGAPCDASRDARWRKLEAVYAVKWPQSVWLFTLAVSHFADGNTKAGLENLACFRAKVAEERERRIAAADAAAWQDYRDMIDDQTRAGVF